jgi:tetratricopeptide (TPR) repeat protein
LYELLAGSPPFTRKELEKAGVLEMLRVIREQEPLKPSTKLSTAEGLPTLAVNRGTEPTKLTKLVRGELDWIVMKALEKNRSRRYETANGFAMDVQRYLADEPVLACPPSAGYRLRKFARRNKGGLAVAALVLSFLVLLGSGVGWAWRDRAAREAEATRQQAERQAKVAGQVELILADVDELMKEQKWPEALATVRRAEAAMTGGEADPATAERVRQRLKDLEFIDRLEQIRMQSATVVEGKIDAAGADREYGRAFRAYGVDVQKLAVETSIERFKARPAIAIPLAAALDDWVFFRRRVSAKDAAGWERLVAVARGIDPEPLRDQLRSTWGQPVSEVQDELRRLADSIKIRAQHPATLISLARTLRGVKHPDSALRLLQDARYVYPGDFWLNFELGNVLHNQKDHEGAIRFFTAAVSIRPNSAAAHYNLGHALYAQKRLDEAIAAYRKAIEHDPKFAWAHGSLGRALLDQKKWDPAIDAFRKAVELDRTVAGYQNLGLALLEQGKQPREAIACFRKAIEIEPEKAENYRNLFSAHVQLEEILRAQGKLDDAIAEIRQVLTEQKKMAAVSPQWTAAYQMRLANLLDDQAWPLLTGGDPKSRDPKRALDLAQEAAALTPNEAACLKTLGVARYRAGDWKAAVEALDKSRQLYADDSVTLFFLSMAHGQLNEKDKGRTFFDSAAQWRMGFGLTEEELRRLCAEAAALLGLEVPPGLREPPVFPPGLTLLKPAAGAILDNGAIDFSKMMVWEFDWSDVPGATQYHLYVIGPEQPGPRQTNPGINNSTLTSSYYRHEVKAMIYGDRGRLGLRWRVRALVKGTWTDWSETRTFDVAPLDDSKPPSPKK